MAEQWIAAHQAYDLASDQFALCARLYAGLTIARAKLFQSNRESKQHVLIPKWFWWAEGRAALQADWTAGDFSTWIDQKVKWSAFGVEFGLDGVLEMLPFEERAAVARKLSVASNADWVTAVEARRIRYKAASQNPVSAGDDLIEQARLGFITARAVLARGEGDERLAPPWEAREWNIPVWFWSGERDSFAGPSNWDHGKFTRVCSTPRGIETVSLSGVHFLRSSLIDPQEIADPADFSTQAKRGPKPRYDWDTVVTGVWGDIYRGDFKPESQAEIERVMQRRLAKGDKEPSESTVRPFASRIWNEFSKA